MKIKKTINERIEVDLTDYSAATVRQALGQIKRHIDDVARVNYMADTIDACSHCGSTWEIDDDGSPMCCAKAYTEWEVKP